MRFAGYCAGLWLLTCLAAPIFAKDAHKPLTVVRIAPGVFFHAGQQAEIHAGNQGDIANLGFVVGSRCVAVLDTGGSPAIGQALRGAIGEKTDLPICYVINTHMHPDHVMGNSAFVSSQTVFVAHANMARALVARSGSYLRRLSRVLDVDADASWIVLPDREVEGALEIDLGQRVLRLQAWPTAHTDNDLTIYDEQTATLWLSDLLFVDRVPSLDGSITGWINAIDDIAARDDVQQVVSGHGRINNTWLDTIQAERRYLSKIRTGVRDAIDEGKTIDYATQHIAIDERSNWLLFDQYHPRNVTAAYTELEWE